MNNNPAIEQAINAQCPFSNKPIQKDSLAVYQGKVIGFCNPDCRDSFVQAIHLISTVMHKVEAKY